MTSSLQQLLAISALLTGAEKAIEAKALSPRDIQAMRTAAEHVRAAFALPAGGLEVKRQT